MSPTLLQLARDTTDFNLFIDLITENYSDLFILLILLLLG